MENKVALTLPGQADDILSPTPAPLPKKQPPPRMREFGDVAAMRNEIYGNALQAAQNVEPLQNDRHILQLQDVDWMDPPNFTKKEHKRAVLSGDTLARRMRGTWVLRNAADGSEIERRSQVIGRVPWLSHIGTFIHRGNEYTINHQQRLRSGVFARQKENGELESHVNVLPGEGASHRYSLDPARGVFKLSIRQAEIPLLPILHHLGCTPRTTSTWIQAVP
jgi:DNA-directed RNA polymerase beta subunit